MTRSGLYLSLLLASLVLGGAERSSAKVNCGKELSKKLSLSQLEALLPQCPKQKADIESRIGREKEVQKQKEESDRLNQEIEQIRREGIGDRFVVPTSPILNRGVRVFIKSKGDFALWGAPQCKVENLNPDESLVFAVIDEKLVYIHGKGKVIVDGEREVLLGR